MRPPSHGTDHTLRVPPFSCRLARRLCRPVDCTRRIAGDQGRLSRLLDVRASIRLAMVLRPAESPEGPLAAGGSWKTVSHPPGTFRSRWSLQSPHWCRRLARAQWRCAAVWIIPQSGPFWKVPLGDMHPDDGPAEIATT